MHVKCLAQCLTYKKRSNMSLAAVTGEGLFPEWLIWHFRFQGYRTTSIIYNIPKGPPNSQLQPVRLWTPSTLPEPVHFRRSLTPGCGFPRTSRPRNAPPPGPCLLHPAPGPTQAPPLLLPRPWPNCLHFLPSEKLKEAPTQILVVR